MKKLEAMELKGELKCDVSRSLIRNMIIVAFSTIFISCNSYTPKPHGYPRLTFPDRSYTIFSESCPFQFEIPTYCIMEKDTHSSAEPCWYNIKFPSFDATIYLSYKNVRSSSDLHKLSEDAYKLAMKNNIKADVINETEILDTTNGNFGILYDLYGETATPFNFYITDRKNHYIRGAFYFNQHTKTDSVSPIFDFLRVDILNMLNTLKWE
jgi:gliding motility-associated lipoprotein GldD